VDIKKIRLTNLIKLIDEYESQRVFCDLIEKDSSYVSQLKNPSNPKNIGEKMARIIETNTGKPQGWMDSLHDEQNGFVGQETPTLIKNVEPGPDITGRVPLISWVQAGSWAEVIDNHAPGDAEDWLLTTARVGRHAFALRVQGDSMTAPHGISIPEGSIVIIDPDQHCDNGNIVVARLEDSMEATLKKLVIDGNQRFLKPLNPAYPVIPINGNCKIIGRAIKVEFEL